MKNTNVFSILFLFFISSSYAQFSPEDSAAVKDVTEYLLHEYEMGQDTFQYEVHFFKSDIPSKMAQLKSYMVFGASSDTFGINKTVERCPCPNTLEIVKKTGKEIITIKKVYYVPSQKLVVYYSGRDQKYFNWWEAKYPDPKIEQDIENVEYLIQNITTQ